MSKFQKTAIFFMILAGILVAAYLIYTQSPKSATGYRPGIFPEADKAVHQAEYIFKLKLDRGEDFKNGPCLSNDLLPNWVADIVHDPRVEADDLPENQCSAYLEGRARHFVELSTEGRLIRVK